MNCISKPFTLLLCLVTTGPMLFFGVTKALARDLSGEEVIELVSGNTVEAITWRGFSVTTYFSPDGTFKQIRDGKPESGTWSVDDQGHLCKKQEEWGRGCLLIKQDSNVWKAYKIPGNPMRQSVHKSTFKKVLEGNPSNL